MGNEKVLFTRLLSERYDDKEKIRVINALGANSILKNALDIFYEDLMDSHISLGDLIRSSPGYEKNKKLFINAELEKMGLISGEENSTEK